MTKTIKHEPMRIAGKKVDAEKNIIEVKGSVPGANSKTVVVMKENYASWTKKY